MNLTQLFRRILKTLCVWDQFSFLEVEKGVEKMEKTRKERSEDKGYKKEMHEMKKEKMTEKYNQSEKQWNRQKEL